MLVITYPGSTNNINFNNSSIPDSKNYIINETDIGVSNISSSSSIMNADFKIDTQTPLPQFSEQTFNFFNRFNGKFGFLGRL